MNNDDMTYNFDEIIDRRGTGCVKWDEEAAVPPPFGGVGSPSGIGGSTTGTAGSLSLIPLWVADMDFAVAPAIQEAIRRRAQHPVFGYTHVQDDYYQSVIAWFKRRHQWQIERDWMLYTTGVQRYSCSLIFSKTPSMFPKSSSLVNLRTRNPFCSSHSVLSASLVCWSGNW